MLNWDQGIRRVVLGALMESGPAGDETPVTLDGQQYLPLGRTSDEQPGALAFALLARSLLADARLLSGVSGPRLRPLGEWADLIRALLTGYLVPAGDNEEGLLARCLTEVDALDALPLGETPVSYRVAATLVERALGRLGGATGQYLAHGVTVTSFVPMRAIPFRVVFVVGLGQAQFPRNGRGGELDLRAARRQLGDVSPREQDLYMFLETLLSTREKLILSYVARDELTGASLAPSSVLLELRDLLAAGYLPPAEVDKLFSPPDRPPLRRYDDTARLRPGTLAHREAGAKGLGQSLRAALPSGAAVPDFPALRRALDEDRLDPLARRLGVNAPPADGKSVLAGLAPGERLVVPLSAIRQFLEDPLQGSARFRLRMREVEGDEELIDREQEAFVTDRPLRAGLLREIMQRVVAAGEPSWPAIEATLAAVARREELRGSAPTGFFAEAERPALVGILQGWLDQLAKWGAGKPLAGRAIRFGRPAPARAHSGRASRSHPAHHSGRRPGAAGRAGSRGGADRRHRPAHRRARSLRIGAVLLPQPDRGQRPPAPRPAAGVRRSPGAHRRRRARGRSWLPGGVGGSRREQSRPGSLPAAAGRRGAALPGRDGRGHGDRGPRHRRATHRRPPLSAALRGRVQRPDAQGGGVAGGGDRKAARRLPGAVRSARSAR